MSISSRRDAVTPNDGGGGDLDQLPETSTAPTLEGAFSEDGVDLTLVRWMLRQSPTDRLRAAQDFIDAAWAFRDDSET